MTESFAILLGFTMRVLSNDEYRVAHHLIAGMWTTTATVATPIAVWDAIWHWVDAMEGAEEGDTQSLTRLPNEEACEYCRAGDDDACYTKYF